MIVSKKSTKSLLQISTNSAWVEIVHLPKSAPRLKRQLPNYNMAALFESIAQIESSAECSCDANNHCPSGPEGPQGEAGMPGTDGMPGLPGKSGLSWEEV